MDLENNLDIKAPCYLTPLERACHERVPLEARWNWHKFVEDSTSDLFRTVCNLNYRYP
jgi:hypothetical protein